MTKKINLIFLLTLILYSLFCALQLGYTWDVLFYYEIGKERLDYLFSLGANKVDEPDHAKYLNGAYSTISAFIVQFFPRKYILEVIYIVNLSRFLEIDPESSLRGTISKFENRFSKVEDELKKRGKSFSESNFKEMDEIWNLIKKSP